MRYKTDYVEIGMLIETVGRDKQISVGINDKEEIPLKVGSLSNKITIPADIFKQHFNKSNFIRHIVNFFIKD